MSARADGPVDTRLRLDALTSQRIRIVAPGPLVLTAVAIDVLACTFWARSLLPFVVCALVLCSQPARPSRFVLSARDVAAQVLTGLTIVAAALFVLYAVGRVIRPSEVYSVEDALARVRLWLEQTTSLSVWHAVAIGMSVLILGAFARSFIGRAKRALEVTTFLLLVVTSFTIYSQVPLQAQVDKVHERDVFAYRAGLEHERQADGEKAAAGALQSELFLHEGRLMQQLDRGARTVQRYLDDIAGQAQDDVAVVASSVFASTPLCDRSPVRTRRLQARASTQECQRIAFPRPFHGARGSRLPTELEAVPTNLRGLRVQHGIVAKVVATARSTRRAAQVEVAKLEARVLTWDRAWAKRRAAAVALVGRDVGGHLVDTAASTLLPRGVPELLREIVHKLVAPGADGPIIRLEAFDSQRWLAEFKRKLAFLRRPTGAADVTVPRPLTRPDARAPDLFRFFHEAESGRSLRLP